MEKEVERLLEVDATAEDVRYGNTSFALLQLIVKMLQIALLNTTLPLYL